MAKNGIGARRKPTAGVAMKYRPPVETTRSTAKGTKPLAEAVSVSHVVMMIVVHACRKILYGVDVHLKVGIYIVGTLLLSLIGDFGKEGSGYFSDKNNFFNVYFVKYSWGWTLFFIVPFMIITGYTTSCGQRQTFKPHLFRLVAATAIWYISTSLFEILEDKSGVCYATKLLNKSACIKGGYRWKGFDISGHTFLLTFASLFILEEGKAYLGWERIKDMLRNEEHKRLSADLPAQGDSEIPQAVSTPLSRLTAEEFLHLRTNYSDLTPYVRALFCSLAVLVILWDFMLICTILYFHIMIEKVVASCIAVLLWFLLYRGICSSSLSSLFCLPGCSGPFRYVTYQTKLTKKDSISRGRPTETKKTGRGDDTPKFMGMPIYGLSRQQQQPVPQAVPQEEELTSTSSFKTSRSRSVSRTRLPRGSSKSSLNLKYL